ncbi:TPA: sensor histidine kinase, partial [Clostridium perfringens]
MECIENDYMNLDLRKTYNLINIFIGIIIILCTAYIFNPYTAINLSKLVETVLMFTITFITTTIFKFSNKKIFILMSICLLFLALLKFKILIGLIIYFGERQILEYINFKSVYICVILEIIYCFLVIDYIKKVEIKTKLVIYLFV